jgi:hypothetical protein
MKKYSILTFLFNGYEFVREPLEVSDDAEYILVTDDENLKSDKWNIKLIPEEYRNASGFTKTFYVRYHPFEFVNTNVCLVLDGSIQINTKLDKFIYDFLDSGKDICLSSACMLSNPFYAEYNWFVKMKGYDQYQARKNMAMLKAIGYNESFKGYFEANIKLCKNDSKTNELHGFVWKTILEVSDDKNNVDRLDQTLLSGIVNIIFPELDVFNICRQAIQSKCLTWMEHNTNKPIVVPININNIWYRNRKIIPYLL